MWDWQWKDLCHLAGSSRGGHSPLGAQLFGVAEQQGPSPLFLSLTESWSLEIALGEGRAVETSGCSHYAPAYLQKQQLPRLSDVCLPHCKPSPNLPSCGWRNCLLFNSCVFRGQDSVLCILLRGAAQIRIWSDLGLTCVISLCTDSNHSIQVGNSSVLLTDQANYSCVVVLSHFKNLWTSCTQAGWHLLQIKSSEFSQAQQTCELLPRTQNQ